MHEAGGTEEKKRHLRTQHNAMSTAGTGTGSPSALTMHRLNTETICCDRCGSEQRIRSDQIRKRYNAVKLRGKKPRASSRRMHPLRICGPIRNAESGQFNERSRQQQLRTLETDEDEGRKVVPKQVDTEQAEDRKHVLGRPRREEIC